MNIFDYFYQQHHYTRADAIDIMINLQNNYTRRNKNCIHWEFIIGAYIFVLDT